MRLEKDFASRWSIEHHADSLLKLVPLPAIESWRPGPTDKVIPRRIPDGLIHVKFRDHATEAPLVIEIETQPSADADRQILEDILLVRLTDRVFPDAVLVLLKPAGHAAVTGEERIVTPGGTVAGVLKWHVIRLWEWQADDLFAMNDIGMAPWIPLTRTAQDAEPFLTRCHEFIEARTPPADLESMRVTLAVLAGVRYDKLLVERIFLGGRKVIDSPVLTDAIKELNDRTRLATLHDSLIRLATRRFGVLSPQILERLRSITDADKLNDLMYQASLAADFESFLGSV